MFAAICPLPRRYAFRVSVMKGSLIIAIAILISACGSTVAFTQSDDGLKRTLQKNNSSCIEMTRVYSGVAYDICRLSSSPDSSFYNPFLVVYLVDMPFSAVVDTVALPVTIYQQSKQGNISIH